MQIQWIQPLSLQKSLRLGWIGISVSMVLGCTQATPSKGTLDTPEEVLEESKAILTMVAKQLQSGQKELVYLQEFTEAKTKLIKE